MHIQDVGKITCNISESNSEPKRRKKLYKHIVDPNKSFPSYNDFYVKKIVIFQQTQLYNCYIVIIKQNVTGNRKY